MDPGCILGVQTIYTYHGFVLRCPSGVLRVCQSLDEISNCDARGPPPVLIPTDVTVTDWINFAAEDGR